MFGFESLLNDGSIEVIVLAADTLENQTKWMSALSKCTTGNIRKSMIFSPPGFHPII